MISIGALGGYFHGVAQTAELVNQSVFQCLNASPHAPLPDGVNLVFCFRATFGAAGEDHVHKANGKAICLRYINAGDKDIMTNR